MYLYFTDYNPLACDMKVSSSLVGNEDRTSVFVCERLSVWLLWMHDSSNETALTGSQSHTQTQFAGTCARSILRLRALAAPRRALILSKALQETQLSMCPYSSWHLICARARVRLCVIVWGCGLVRFGMNSRTESQMARLYPSNLLHSGTTGSI